MKKLEKFNFYLSQLKRRNNGEKFIGDKEISSTFKMKSGKFAEQCVAEILLPHYVSRGEKRIIRRTSNLARQQTFQADGYLKSLNAYVEVKNYSFNSGGTADEKLPGFFFKLEEYDKPALIILCGEFELLSDDFSTKIWHAFHTPNKMKQYKATFAIVNSVRNKIIDVIKLSELQTWHKSKTKSC